MPQRREVWGRSDAVSLATAFGEANRERDFFVMVVASSSEVTSHVQLAEVTCANR